MLDASSVSGSRIGMPHEFPFAPVARMGAWILGSSPRMTPREKVGWVLKRERRSDEGEDVRPETTKRTAGTTVMA